MNVLVISAYDKKMETVGRLYSMNHRAYCASYNIPYELKLRNFTTIGNISWDKIERIIHHIESKEFEYIFWIDADAIFLNPSLHIKHLLSVKPLREIIIFRDNTRTIIDVPEPKNPFLYLSSANIHGPGLGVFLVRCCQEALVFFRALLNRRAEFLEYPADERAFNEMLHEKFNADGIAFLNQNAMYSFWPVARNTDFVLHVASTPEMERINLFHLFNPYREIQFHVWLSQNPHTRRFYESFGSERRNRIYKL